MKSITQFGFGDAETWEGKSPDLEDFEPITVGIPVGETVLIKNRLFLIVTELDPEDCSCNGCSFYIEKEYKCCRPNEPLLNLSCDSEERSDNQSIIFRELTDA